MAVWVPLLVLGVLAPAKTFFVSPTGNDADDGSKGRPFRTPQKAIRAAADGDEVRLAKAHYGGSLRSDKRLRFLAWNGTSTLGTGVPSVDAGPDQTRPIAPQDVGRDPRRIANRVYQRPKTIPRMR